MTDNQDHDAGDENVPRPRQRLPGDPTHEEMIARIIRVDHAGEAGANRIYAGQLAVLGKSAAGDIIRHMVAQEAEHFEQFDQLLRDRQVRPTLLSPFWHVAGFALGAGTALLGKNAAMVCTAAVEEAIDEHYRGQVEYLGEDEPELRETILAANADEIEHRDTARAEGANSSGAYAPLSTAIKAGTKLAIWFSERV